MNLARMSARLLVAAGLAAALAACATGPEPAPLPAEPQRPAALPPPFAPEELVGRWGFASYHKEDDRGRTERAAQGQCRNPYNIGRAPGGGIMMHPADQPQQVEMRVKGSQGGKTYIGPEPWPGAPTDREVVSFDGRVLVLKWLESEVQGRYGNGVYVRCAPRA